MSQPGGRGVREERGVQAAVVSLALLAPTGRPRARQACLSHSRRRSMRPPISQVVVAPAVSAAGSSAAKAWPHSRDSEGQMRTIARARVGANLRADFGVVVDIAFYALPKAGFQNLRFWASASSSRAQARASEVRR